MTERRLLRQRPALKLFLTPMLLLLLAAIPATMLPTARADSSVYTIPLEGARWANYTIGVVVPAYPSWAHDAAVQALNTWDHAQHWFAGNYFPGGKTYDFAISSADNASANGQVVIQFVDGNESYAGRADLTYMSRSRAITLATVSLPQSFERKPLDSSYAPWFTRLALRVFGHVMGLDWATICDIMQQDSDPSCSVDSLSTLDLYALHVLAEGSIPPSVTLPSTIPYTTMSVARDQSQPIPVILVFASLGLVCCSVVGVRRHAGASDDENSLGRPNGFFAEKDQRT